MDKNEVTVLHWLALMPVLRGQGWHATAGHGWLRNANDDCPLTALSAELGYERRFSWAFRDAVRDMLQGQPSKDDDMVAVARAADNRSDCRATRRELMLALGMQPDC